MTIQNVTGAIPIVAIEPPPEGKRGAEFVFTFASGNTVLSQQLQLNSQSGVNLSQVVTICIDNTESNVPIIVTHGAFSEQITVAAYSYVIVPTFSSQGFFNILIQQINAATCEVSVVLLNYSRPSSSLIGANGLQSNIPINPIPTLTRTAIRANNFAFTGIQFVNFFYFPAFLYDFRVNVTAYNAIAAGACSTTMSFADRNNLNTFEIVNNTTIASAAGLTPANYNVYRNFNTNPLFLPNGMIMQLTQVENASSVFIIVSYSILPIGNNA